MLSFCLSTFGFVFSNGKAPLLGWDQMAVLVYEKHPIFLHLENHVFHLQFILAHHPPALWRAILLVLAECKQGKDAYASPCYFCQRSYQQWTLVMVPFAVIHAHIITRVKHMGCFASFLRHTFLFHHSDTILPWCHLSKPSKVQNPGGLFSGRLFRPSCSWMYRFLPW